MFQSTPSGGKATRHAAQPETAFLCVSIHAFRGEGDRCDLAGAGEDCEFQSTPSGGKATRDGAGMGGSHGCFNPRLPGGRRLGWTLIVENPKLFQSTPSGGKATPRINKGVDACTLFQSTPSGGKATGGSLSLSSNRSFNPRLPGGRRQDADKRTRHVALVSIHAFRGEGDW